MISVAGLAMCLGVLLGANGPKDDERIPATIVKVSDDEVTIKQKGSDKEVTFPLKKVKIFDAEDKEVKQSDAAKKLKPGSQITLSKPIINGGPPEKLTIRLKKDDREE
jgi:hypothetical protein